MEVRLVVAAVRRRLLLIVALGLVGALAALTYAQGQSGNYRATAQLLLDPTAVTIPGGQQFNGDPERYVGGQLSLLRSRATAARAAEEIGVETDAVTDALTVERLVGSDVVDVVGTASSPRLARDVANAVVEAYVTQRREATSAAVAAQLESVQEEITAVEAQLRAFPVRQQVDPRQQVLANQYEQLLERRLTLTAPGVVRDKTAVLDPAVLPEEPQRLSSAIAGGAGGLLGVLLGTVLAVVFEGRRPRVTSRPQAERLLGRRVEAVFPQSRAAGTPEALQPARVLLALIAAHPVQGRRIIAVSSSAAGQGVVPVADSLMAVLQERGTGARLLHVEEDLGPSRSAVAEHVPVKNLSNRRKGDDGTGVMVTEEEPAPPRQRAPRGADLAEKVRALPSDVDAVVLVLPPVLESPTTAEVARWASDLVVVVPLRTQTEAELLTAQQLFSSGTAVVHPVFLTGRARKRG